MLIGFTGKRGVGKSEAAGFLEQVGFVRCHALEGGKAMVVAYFEHLGVAADTARRMVHGDLKDTPSPLLPRNSTPRQLMEPFGYFMGVTMGADWTLGLELKRLARTVPGANVVIESLVYEEPQLRAAGGIVVRVVRPDHLGPAGEKTDAAEVLIAADVTIVNDGSIEDLRAKVLALVG